MVEDSQRDKQETEDAEAAGHPERALDDANEPGPAGISLLRVMNIFLRHRWLIALMSTTVAILVVAVSLVVPETYTSTAALTPHSGEGQAPRLAGLASQFGVSIPTGEVGQSPQFYAKLLESRELLRETVENRYEVATSAPDSDSEVRSGDLVELFEVEEEKRRLGVAVAIEKLREVVDVATDPETGVVELAVTTPWPALSKQVADRMLELVNRFNLQTRQTQAAAERRFIESQLAKAESTLRAAEDSLERFLARNRRYENSPPLRFKYERLQRRVSLNQQLYTTLSESYQQARIDEVRNTPVITVIVPPELPARPDQRRLALRGVLGLLLGGVLGAMWAFGREMLATSQERDPDDFKEFERLKSATAEDIVGLWRRVRNKLR